MFSGKKAAGDRFSVRDLKQRPAEFKEGTTPTGPDGLVGCQNDMSQNWIGLTISPLEVQTYGQTNKQIQYTWEGEDNTRTDGKNRHNKRAERRTETIIMSVENILKLYVPCIILQFVYKPTRCTKLLWLDFIFH